MRNLRRISLCLVFAVLCLTPALVYAQDDDPDEQSGRADTPGKATLLIINGSNSTRVNFSVRNGDSDWADFSLNPRHDLFFRNTTSIRIVTDNGNSVEYGLDYNNRYKIFWNAAEQRWDVTRLVPRK